MSGLKYLTVQDILWINLQVTKKVNHYNFAKLEEASFYQYSYGDSNSLVKQAARFFPGFVRMKPFDVGNSVTAFVAGLAFLELNGHHVNLDNDGAVDWFSQIQKNPAEAAALIEKVASADTHGHGHELTVKQAITNVMGKFSCAIEKLTGAEKETANA